MRKPDTNGTNLSPYIRCGIGKQYNAEVKVNLGMHYIPKTMGHLGYNLELPPLFEQYVEAVLWYVSL